MLKKILVILLLITAVFAVGISGAFAEGDGDCIVRVKLGKGTTKPITFFLDGSYSVEGNDSVKLERQLYRVEAVGKQLYLYYGTTKLCESGASLRFVQHTAPDGYNNFFVIYNNDKNAFLKYLGDLEFRLLDTGYILTINHIYLDDYLYGVVPHEMSDSFPMEALKAQAVAARNFTKRQIKATDYYDLTDDSSLDQVYKGYTPSNDRSIAAVNSTEGQVLMYGSTVIEAFYSASNGGMTELPYHRWGGSDSGSWRYYQMVEDPYDLANPSSIYETLMFPVAIDADHPIKAWGHYDNPPSISRAVTYIETAILLSGKVKGADSISDFKLTGITALKANTYDYTLNDSGVKTQDHERKPAYEPDGWVNPCIDMIRATGDFTVLKGSETISVKDVTLKLDYLSGAFDSTNDKYVAFHSILGAFVVEPVYNDSSELTGFTITQNRYGHACGLSQRGAQQRAKSDDPEVNTYDKILAFYYPNTTLETLPYTRPALTPVVDPAEDHTNATLTKGMNVRTGSGTEHSSVGELFAGARIMSVGPVTNDKGETWYKIIYGGEYMYIGGSGVHPDGGGTAKMCTVTYETNGGEPKAPQTKYFGSCMYSAPAATRNGYDLEGWYSDEGLTSKIEFPYIVMDDIKMYANWTMATYTISYNLGGGVLAAENPATYTFVTEEFTLINPTRVCYTFTGWTGTGLSGLTQTVTIPTGSYGNKSYKANWQALVPDVTAAVTGYDRVSLSWSGVEGAVGYEVLRASSSGGTYTVVSGDTPLTETAFAQTGLKAGTTYYYRVRGLFSDGTNTVKGVLSPYKSLRPGPLPPETISATANSYSSITISWSQAPEASGYLVYRSTKENGTYSRIATIYSASTTSYRNTGLYTGTPYYYYIRSFRGSTSIYGSCSAVATAVTYLTPMSGVTAATYYPTAIKISWNAVSGRTGYRVYRSYAPEGPYTYLGYTTYTYYKNIGLAVGKTYYYKVRAYRTVNGKNIYNDYSPEASDTTRVFQTTGVKAAMYYVTSNKVTWSSVPGASGYEVSRCDTEDGKYSPLNTTGYTYYYDKTIEAGKTYYYKVRAYRKTSTGNVYGEDSEARVCISKVAGVKAVMYAVNSNKISWSAVPGRTAYEVYWAESQDGEFTKISTASPLTSTYIYHKDREPAKTYYYKVLAYQMLNNERKDSGYSDTVSIVNKMTGAKAVRYSYNSNKITWNSVASRTAYELYRCDEAGNVDLLAPPLKVTGYTYYIDSGLTTDKTYYYRVRAYQMIGGNKIYCNFSDKTYAAPYLSSVTGAKASRYSSSKIKLTWYSVSGATGYEIERCTTGTDFVRIKTTTSRYYYDSGLKRGTRYYYRVRAYRIVGENTYYGNWSKKVYATP